MDDKQILKGENSLTQDNNQMVAADRCRTLGLDEKLAKNGVSDHTTFTLVEAADFLEISEKNVLEACLNSNKFGAYIDYKKFQVTTRNINHELREIKVRIESGTINSSYKYSRQGLLRLVKKTDPDTEHFCQYKKYTLEWLNCKGVIEISLDGSSQTAGDKNFILNFFPVAKSLSQYALNQYFLVLPEKDHHNKERKVKLTSEDLLFVRSELEEHKAYLDGSNAGTNVRVNVLAGKPSIHAVLARVIEGVAVGCRSIKELPPFFTIFDALVADVKKQKRKYDTKEIILKCDNGNKILWKTKKVKREPASITYQTLEALYSRWKKEGTIQFL